MKLTCPQSHLPPDYGCYPPVAWSGYPVLPPIHGRLPPMVRLLVFRCLTHYPLAFLCVPACHQLARSDQENETGPG